MKHIPLHTRILAGLVIGIGLASLADAGLVSHESTKWIAREIADPVGQLFLRLLVVLVVPMVFSSLVGGVAAIGDVRRVGRIGLFSILYTIIFSGFAVVIGLVLANLIEPGRRLSPEVMKILTEQYSSLAKASVESATAAAGPGDAALMTMVKTLVPTNIFAAVAKDPPDMIGLMLFSVFLGTAMTMTEKSKPVLDFLEGLYEACAKCVEVIMMMAPVAVMGLSFSLVARLGLGFLSGLGWFVFTVLLALGIQLLIVYPIFLMVLARLNPILFFRQIRLVITTAFSTASSNATLPTSLRVAENNLGLPRQVSTFVLTVGATANQNGTALYEGVTVLFLAQLAGVDLTLEKQLGVVYLAILGGIGTAGIPAGSIPFIILILASIGVNPALIAVILGVDRFLDMCRTVLNVTGDLVMAAAVARADQPKNSSA